MVSTNVLKTGFLIEPVGVMFSGSTGFIFLYVFNYPAYIDYKTCHLFSITNVNKMQHIKTIIIEANIKQRSPKQTQKSKTIQFNPVHSGSIHQPVEPVFLPNRPVQSGQEIVIKPVQIEPFSPPIPGSTGSTSWFKPVFKTLGLTHIDEHNILCCFLFAQ